MTDQKLWAADTYAPFSLAKVKASPCGPTIEAELESIRHRSWSLGSPSQVSTFRSCERKWWLKQIGGIFTPQSPSQLLGIDVHADMGAMLETGHAPEPAAEPERQRAQEIALAGYSWLRSRPGGVPLVAPDALAVARALYVDAWPVPVVAELDWLVGPREIVDFKTSSSKLATTAAKLLTDPQAVIYSAAVCSRPSELRPPVKLGRPGAERRYAPVVLGELEPVSFGLLHLRTKGPLTVESVNVDMTPEIIAAGLDGIGETLRAMRETSADVSPRDVKPTASACYEFGPCPFIEHCKFLGDRDMTAIPNPFARPAAPVEVVAVETLPALTPEEKFGTRPAPMPSRLAALNAASRPEVEVEAAPAAEAPPVETAPAAEAQATEATPAPKPSRARECVPTHEAIPLRWRGHLRSQLSSQVVGACRNDLAIACRAAGHDVPLGAPSTLRREQIAEVAAFVALLTGVRPWGDEDDRPAPAPSPAAPATAPEAPSTPPAPTPAVNVLPRPPESPATQVDAGGRLLFVDCRPRAGDYTELVDLMAPLYRWVEAERKVAHYMVLPYGEGPKLAAAGLHHALRAGEVTLPARLVVLRSTPGAAEALVELGAYYSRDQIVEGTR